MPFERSKRTDHRPLTPPRKRNDMLSSGPQTLKRSFSERERDLDAIQPEPGVYEFSSTAPDQKNVETPVHAGQETVIGIDPARQKGGERNDLPVASVNDQKKQQKDFSLLHQDRWLTNRGHFFTYIGLFLFSIMVLFRPYETVPGLEFLSATAFYFALATLAIYFPSQIIAESNLTMMSTEVKAILALTLIALVTMPIAKDPLTAWDTFVDPYIKAVVIFVVMVNVVRTRARLSGLLWLSFGIGLYLSFAAINLYLQGKFSVESYRVAVEVGGMYGNPNEMAIHFVIMTPLAIALGIAAKGVRRTLYFAMAALFVAANMVTFSRGGFLGLIAAAGVFAWKVGRKYRLNVAIASILVGGLAIVAAPGNYGLRMLSIFIPGLDAVGSSDQRMELLKRSLLVTARNPWGIGIGNFPIVGMHNLQSHNAFTQVSSELGILGLAAYLVFMVSPFRKLAAIERTLFAEEEHDWFYYLSIGLQASIVGYMVSSFFASVAYIWFIYYLIAYAVAFRRVYQTSDLKKGNSETPVEHWGVEPITA